MAIIDHDDWRLVMRNRIKEGNVVTSPMRKLIKKLPGKVLTKITKPTWRHRFAKIAKRANSIVGMNLAGFLRRTHKLF